MKFKSIFNLDLELAEDCGLINQKSGVSLTKRPAKGYEKILAVGFKIDGRD